jgi:hypothetical protein
MPDQIDDQMQPLMAFLGKLREAYIENSELPTLQAAQEFDEAMHPLAAARAREIQQEASADLPSRAEMLMELVLEVEQVVSLVPPRLRRYRELLAAEGLDKTVLTPAAAGDQGGPDGEAEGGREGLPGINLADQASLEFHSQLLSLSFAIAQDEVSQRMEKRAKGGDLR